METNPLTLIVKEKTLGNLVTNAKDIKAYVEEKLKEYSVDNYPGDAKSAARDKAEINNSIKTLNDRRIALEKEWNMPFQEFKDIIADTCEMMKDASGKLDLIVKAKEEEEKAQKKVQIEELWKGKNFTLVNLDRVFNSRWLNKTTKLSSVDSEIDDIIKRITGDLASLDAFGDDTAILKDLYLSTLNLQMALTKGAELKANRERLALMEAQKKSEKEKQLDDAEKKEPERNEKTANGNTGGIGPYNTYCAHKETSTSEQSVIKNTEWFHMFNVYGTYENIECVKAAALETGIEIVSGITMRGTVDQINIFKELISKNGFSYDKKGITCLEIKKIG